MKKKTAVQGKSLKRRTLITAVCVTCVLSLSACGKKNNNNENKDPLTGEDMSQTENGSDEGSGTNAGSTEGADNSDSADNSNSADNSKTFQDMINDENSDPNSIIDFINTNIVSAGAADVKNFFSGLLGFGDDVRNIDFTKLESSRQYMPEDMIAFSDLMKLEADTPSMVMSDEENRRVINMTLSEMLERALLFEQHLQKYPNDVTTDAASRLYEEIATNAISGGYNKAEGVSHYYKGDSEDVVDDEALKYYQQFADANPDSNLGKIVKEYVGILQSNQFKINDEMEQFYKGLGQKLNVSRLSNEASGNGTNGSDSNGGGTNGDGTNGNGTNGSNADKNGTANNSTASNGKGTEGADTVIQGTVSR